MTPIRTLAEAFAHCGRQAYLLSVAKDGPHTGNVTIDLRSNGISCDVRRQEYRALAPTSHYFGRRLNRRLRLDRQWYGCK
jgi:hypothetical protein